MIAWWTRLSPYACRKYIGYRGLVSFMASDSDLMVFRRFDKLHIRALLVLQDKLSELEEQFELLDTRYSTGDEDVNNGTLRGDKPKRRKLHGELIPSLDAYGDAPLPKEIRNLQYGEHLLTELQAKYCYSIPLSCRSQNHQNGARKASNTGFITTGIQLPQKKHVSLNTARI